MVDTARAVFGVDDFEELVVQSETGGIIVEGAVGLADLALREVGEQSTVQLAGERTAAMAANLMLVPTGDRGATPVIDAGA